MGVAEEAAADQDIAKARHTVEMTAGWLVQSRAQFPELDRLDEMALLYTQLISRAGQVNVRVLLGVAIQLLADHHMPEK